MAGTRKSIGSGGAPVQNTLDRDWRSQLEMVWEKRRSLRCKPNLLLQRMHAIDPVNTTSDYDFRRKLNGKRPSSEAFAAVLFEAAGLRPLGCSLNAFIAGGDEWEREVHAIDGVDLQGVLDQKLRPDALFLEVTETLEVHPPSSAAVAMSLDETRRTRRIGEGEPRPRISIGGRMQLTLSYDGDDPLSSAHILLLEYDTVAGDWQVFNAVAGSGIDISVPYTFLLEGGKRVSRIVPDHLVQGPPHPFDLYALVRSAAFSPDHVALVRKMTASNGIPDLGSLLKLRHLIENDMNGTFVARASYEVR